MKTGKDVARHEVVFAAGPGHGDPFAINVLALDLGLPFLGEVLLHSQLRSGLGNHGTLLELVSYLNYGSWLLPICGGL